MEANSHTPAYNIAKQTPPDMVIDSAKFYDALHAEVGLTPPEHGYPTDKPVDAIPAQPVFPPPEISPMPEDTSEIITDDTSEMQSEKPYHDKSIKFLTGKILDGTASEELVKEFMTRKSITIPELVEIAHIEGEGSNAHNIAMQKIDVELTRLLGHKPFNEVLTLIKSGTLDTASKNMLNGRLQNVLSGMMNSEPSPFLAPPTGAAVEHEAPKIAPFAVHVPDNTALTTPTEHAIDETPSNIESSTAHEDVEETYMDSLANIGEAWYGQVDDEIFFKENQVAINDGLMSLTNEIGSGENPFVNLDEEKCDNILELFKEYLPGRASVDGDENSLLVDGSPDGFIEHIKSLINAAHGKEIYPLENAPAITTNNEDSPVDAGILDNSQPVPAPGETASLDEDIGFIPDVNPVSVVAPAEVTPSSDTVNGDYDFNWEDGYEDDLAGFVPSFSAGIDPLIGGETSGAAADDTAEFIPNNNARTAPVTISEILGTINLGRVRNPLGRGARTVIASVVEPAATTLEAGNFDDYLKGLSPDDKAALESLPDNLQQRAYDRSRGMVEINSPTFEDYAASLDDKDRETLRTLSTELQDSAFNRWLQGQTTTNSPKSVGDLVKGLFNREKTTTKA